MVKVSVAKATEGAAPNKPAKLLGLRTSPVKANRDTTVPPTRKRMKISLIEKSHDKPLTKFFRNTIVTNAGMPARCVALGHKPQEVKKKT
jgi:hypothetical protein